MSLSGQWIARYSGSNAGTLVMDIDDMGTTMKVLPAPGMITQRYQVRGSGFRQLTKRNRSR
jgi:hypothetical protein